MYNIVFSINRFFKAVFQYVYHGDGIENVTTHGNSFLPEGHSAKNENCTI